MFLFFIFIKTCQLMRNLQTFSTDCNLTIVIMLIICLLMADLDNLLYIIIKLGLNAYM